MSTEETNMIVITNCHRLPRRDGNGPDPIIVKFGCMGDRDATLEAAKSRGFIKGRKPVMAYSDLPTDMKRERGRLAEVAKKLRQEGKKARIMVVSTRVFLQWKDKSSPGPWLPYK